MQQILKKICEEKFLLFIDLHSSADYINIRYGKEILTPVVEVNIRRNLNFAHAPFAI
jgi:hypothetical protein